MGAFGGLILTNKGRALQAKAQAGTQLNFTRVGIGDGSLTGQSIPDLNTLISEKKSLAITKLKTQSTDKAVVGAVLSNQDIVTGFYFREIGVFAQDPDAGEILYCYGNAGAGAEYIPAGGGADIVEKNIDIVTIVGNVLSVSATIDNSLVYATYQELSAHTSNLVIHVTQDEKNVWNSKADGNHVHSASQISTSTVGQTVQSEIDSLKSSVSSGKQQVATTITGKGGTVADADGDGIPTFQELSDGVNSIPQAQGNANTSDVLSGKTFTSAVYGADIQTGTMPNNGAVTITPSTTDQTIAQGYHSGLGKVIGDADLVSGNIKAGANIFGVAGKSSVVETADANALDLQILSGQTAYVNGSKVIGTMPNYNSAVAKKTFTPGTADQNIAAGFYGTTYPSVVKGDPDLTAGNIKAGVDIFGVVGSYDKIYGVGDFVYVDNINKGLNYVNTPKYTMNGACDIKNSDDFILLDDPYVYRYNLDTLISGGNTNIWSFNIGASSSGSMVASVDNVNQKIAIVAAYVFKIIDFSANVLATPPNITNAGGTSQWVYDIKEKDGYFYLAVAGTSPEVQKFSGAGTMVSRYSLSSIIGANQIRTLDYSPIDNVWFITSEDKKLHKFDVNFNLIASYTLDMTDIPVRVRVDKTTGDVYIFGGQGELQKRNASGVKIWGTASVGITTTQRITVSDDGKLVFVAVGYAYRRINVSTGAIIFGVGVDGTCYVGDIVGYANDGTVFLPTGDRSTTGLSRLVTLKEKIIVA